MNRRACTTEQFSTLHLPLSASKLLSSIEHLHSNLIENRYFSWSISVFSCRRIRNRTSCSYFDHWSWFEIIKQSKAERSDNIPKNHLLYPLCIFDLRLLQYVWYLSPLVCTQTQSQDDFKATLNEIVMNCDSFLILEGKFSLCLPHRTVNRVSCNTAAVEAGGIHCLAKEHFSFRVNDTPPSYYCASVCCSLEISFYPDIRQIHQ